MARAKWGGAFALASIVVLPSAAMAAGPASKIFREWIVGCDNLKSCTAMSLPAETDEHVAFLRLERAAGPLAAPKLVVRVRAEKLAAPLAAALDLDGAPFPAPGKRLAAAVADDDNATIALSSAEAEALIAAARKATKLTVTIAGKSLDVSLAGSVAALLWLDEQQSRLDTTSALIRKGPGAAAAAAALPVIAAKGTSASALEPKAVKTVTTALRKQLKRLDPDQCEDAPDDMAEVDGAWPLAGGARLVGLLCSRGAYNLSTGFWILPGGDLAKARKALFPQLDGKPDNMLVNADYDPANGQVSFFNKGRGIGDCGASGSYAWTGSGFVLTGFQAMDACRGINADDWITLFKSEVQLAR